MSDNNFSASLSFGHSFDGVFIPTDVHAGNTGYFPNPSPQFLVARRDNETLPLLGHVRQTVVGVSLLLTVARDSLKARVLGQPQCNLVFPTQFFEFGHDAVRDAGDALGQQAVHHGSDHVELFAEIIYYVVLEQEEKKQCEKIWLPNFIEINAVSVPKEQKSIITLQYSSVSFNNKIRFDNT